MACELAIPPHAGAPLFPPARRLCKLKYYNNCLFYNVQRNFIAQSGDPTNTGKGGESVWGVLYGEQVRSGVAGTRSCSHAVPGFGTGAAAVELTGCTTCSCISATCSTWLVGPSTFGCTLARMQARYFEDEIRPHLKHKRKGLLGMAGAYFIASTPCRISRGCLLMVPLLRPCRHRLLPPLLLALTAFAVGSLLTPPA